MAHPLVITDQHRKLWFPPFYGQDPGSNPSLSMAMVLWFHHKEKERSQVRVEIPWTPV